MINWQAVGTWIKDSAGYAAAILGIVGFMTTMFWKPIKKAVEKHKTKKAEAAAKEAASEQRAQNNATMLTKIDERIGTMRGQIESVQNDVAKIKSTLDDVEFEVATLEQDRLSQAHEYYMRQGWCDPLRKQILCEWYQMYSSKVDKNGRPRNHQAEHYEDDILSLPDFPPERRQTRDSHYSNENDENDKNDQEGD